MVRSALAIAVLALAFCMAPAPAQAHVVAAGIASSLGITSTVGTALVEIGTSLVLSASSKALMPKPDLPQRAVSIRAPVAPRDIVYGRSRKGGTVVYMDARNGGADLDMVIVLATHQVREIGAVYFNGVRAFAAGATTPEPWLQNSAGLERMFGAADQTGSAYLRANSPGLWTAAHRLQGCAAIMVTLRASPDVYPSGMPNVTADIRGKEDILDPRTGLRDYSENAALCLADYMAHATFGIGAAIGAADGINSARLIEAANICDEIVAKAGGETEPRYSCNGVVTLDQAPKTIIEAMLSSMAGNVVWQAGQWHVLAGAYRAPLLTFTEDDVAGNGWQLKTRVSRSENFNAVRGQFISPENDWQPDDFPAYASSVYLAEDGGERVWDDITLPFTLSSSTAQRLAKIHLERRRRQMAVAMTGKLSTWRAAVGDTVLASYDRWGFAAKPFTVARVGLTLSAEGDRPVLTPELVLQETSPAVYDWSATEETIYAAAPRTTLPSAFEVAAPGAISVTESKYVTATGSGVKVRVQLDWVASAAGSLVRDYRVEARLAGASAWTDFGVTPQTSMILDDWTPGTWEFGVTARSLLGRSSVRQTVIRQIAGLSDVPAQLQEVRLQIANGLAVISWQQSPDIDVRIGGSIEIRHSGAASPALSNSYRIALMPGASAQAVVPQLPGTYLVRAVDSTGTYGPPVMIDASGATALAFAPVATLQADPTFAGTHTDTEVIASALRLTSLETVNDWPLVSAVEQVGASGGFVASGTYQFATGMDFGSVKRVRLRADLALTADNPLDTIGARLGNVSTWARVTGGDGSEVDVEMQARITPDDPAGSPVWSAWNRVDSAEVQARGVQARAVLKALDASFTPNVTRLRMTAEEIA